jgi:myo-inositol-1(or 4)-monophosphatase
MNDVQRWLEQAVAAAQKGGRVIRAAWEEGGTAVRYKGRFNPVTEVDLESQRLIREGLIGLNPDHDFLGEEDPGASCSSDFIWIVDPLDGTKNFAHGYPHFAVSIALEHRGQVVLGVVHDPLRGETFTAWRGGGAYLNGRAIQASLTESLEHSLLVTGFGMAARVDFDIFWALEEPSQGVRRDGSAALDLCYVACGRLDGYFQLNLWPWDVAAGVLLVEEAQGMVTDYHGGRFDCRGRQLVASNVKLHRAMLERIQPHLPEVERVCPAASRR